jgi:hypothetical protein
MNPLRLTSRARSGSRVAILVLVAVPTNILLLGHQAYAFNSEEHKVLVDLGAAQVVPDPSIVLPYPGFESWAVSQLHAAYTAAKRLAVGYADNNSTWDSACEPFAGEASPYPSGYDQYRLQVQDNSYWDSGHESFNQIEGNMNMWIPPTDLVRERTLWVSAHLDGTARAFTFGDLVSIYGDYRRTTHCVGGNCYLSDQTLTTIDFDRGTNCYGTWPFETCGYRPSSLRSDVYLKHIAAGLWPPFGCLGNTLSNIANDDEYDDAGWWGDEMMRIANVNDWHFSRAGMAWYVGMHRLALLHVDAARADPSRWTAALHYEANALHSLTDLFCFGHIVTNRDETSYGVMVDESLTGHSAYLWMENALHMGGASRIDGENAGRVELSVALPRVSDRVAPRNDFMESYLWAWANWARWEHTYHSDFNASGATVRNLRGDRFYIRGDGQVRNYGPTDRDVIVGAVRTSLQCLFDAYVRLQSGASIDDVAGPGSSYFDALRWIPVFVESDPGNHFAGRWTRYAGALAGIAGSSLVPNNWANCEMAYINGDSNLPTPSAAPCTNFPPVTSVWIENLAVTTHEDRVSLSWGLSDQAVRELRGVQVQRADGSAGPYVNRSTAALVPSRSMSFEDTAVETGRTYWYRLELVSHDGSPEIVGPVPAQVGGATSLGTALATPMVSSAGPIEIGFSLGVTAGAARLDLYDVAGRLVRSLGQGMTGPGRYLLTWDRRDEGGARVSRGVYVLRLRAGGAGDSKKLVLAHE